MTSSSGNGQSSHGPRAGIFIKPNGVGLPPEVSRMESPEIMALLRSLDDEGTRRAGERYTALGHALNEIAVRIAGHSDHLARHWRGRAAAGAMRTFQDMHDYAAQLAAQAIQTGAVLKWMGNDVLPQYKHLQDPSSVHGVTREHANTAARAYLTSLSDHVIAANKAMPSRIVGTPSSPHAGTRSAAAPAVSSPNPFPGGTTGGTHVPGGGAATVQKTVQAPPAATLQAAGPAAPPAPAAMAPAGSVPAPAAGGPNGLGIMPVMPGASGAGAAGDAPASAAASASEGAAAPGAGADSAGASGAAGSEEGLAAAPMMGGAGGQQEQERQRYAWMEDDDDIWGVPAEGTSGPLIG